MVEGDQRVLPMKPYFVKIETTAYFTYIIHVRQIPVLVGVRNTGWGRGSSLGRRSISLAVMMKTEVEGTLTLSEIQRVGYVDTSRC